MSNFIAKQRLTKEYKKMQKENVLDNVNVSLPDENNIFKWNAILFGPNDSVYSGGLFKLSVEFTHEFPFKPPIIKFMTPIYHPNVNEEGSICVDILKNKWSPALTIDKVLLSILSLMTDPNCKDPLREQIADEYTQNRDKFNQNAIEWTRKYAQEL